MYEKRSGHETPPKVLFATASRLDLATVKMQGLKPVPERHHVLFESQSEAAEKGAAAGEEVVILVPALEMHKAGHKFYRSEGNAWLVESVPSDYIFLPGW